EVFGKGLSDLGVFPQDEQAIAGVTQTQFLRRTHHAVRFNISNFANLDGERRGLARFERQRSARQNKRNFVAWLEVVRTANNLAFAVTVVDAADRELVGIGVLVLGDDLRNDNAFKFA